MDIRYKSTFLQSNSNVHSVHCQILWCCWCYKSFSLTLLSWQNPGLNPNTPLKWERPFNFHPSLTINRHLPSAVCERPKIYMRPVVFQSYFSQVCSKRKTKNSPSSDLNYQPEFCRPFAASTNKCTIACRCLEIWGYYMAFSNVIIIPNCF